MKRRPAIIATALAAALALAGCSGSGDAGEDGTTTITFLSWTGEDQMVPMLESFAEAHPDIRVDVSYSPPVAEYIQTLQTRVLSGTAPDVFIMAAENKTNLIDGGHVLDLSDQPWVDKIAPLNLETYGRDGSYYALSLTSWAGGIAYDVDELAALGYDGIPETWDEFLEMAQDIADSGQRPYLEAVDAMPTAVSAMVGARNSGMEPSLDELIFSGESTFAEQWTPVLEQYQRLFTEGIVSSDVVALDGEQVRDEFANGRVAMIGTAPWVISGIREANPDKNFVFAPVPGADGDDPFQAGAASPGYAINSKAGEAQQEAAKVFLEWLATPEAVQQFTDMNKEIPVTSDYEPTPDPAVEPLVDAIRNGELYLPMISWQRDEDILNVEAVAQIQRMAQGQITPEQVAQALDAKLAAS